MPQAFYILFGAAFCSAVSIALGKLVLRKLKVPLYAQEEACLGFVVGAACLSTVMFGLSVTHLVYKGVLLGLGFAVLALGWYQGRGGVALPRLPALPRRLLWIYGPIAAVFVVLTFFHAMAPEMSPDGSAYHLGFVSRYYRAHGFVYITTNMYASLTQGVEMLFLFAYAFGRHSSAALVHFAFLVALPWLVVSYGRRFGFAEAGLGAAMMVFVSPVVGIDGASAYNDVAVAVILFAVFYLVQIWDETRANALLIPMGLVAGFAFGSKYTAFWAIPYAVGFLIWRLRKRSVRAVALVAVVVAAMVVPWLVKNAVVVSNPVAPFFNKVFPNPYVHISFEQSYSHDMRNYPGLESHWDIPLEVTVRGRILCGLLGPLFLLAPVALLGLGKPQGRRVLFAAALFGSVYAANIGTRFLIPALPFLALGMAMVFVRVKWLLPGVVVLHALSAWPPFMTYYCDQYAWRLDRILLKPALRMETEDGYLRRKWPGYEVARMVEDNTSPDAKVLTFTQTSDAYTSRNVMTTYTSAQGTLFGEMMWTAMIPDYQARRHLQFSFPERAVRKVRIRQTVTHPSDRWTVAEVRIFSNGHELERLPSWRLQARPNPWDVQYAFDNSPLTMWSSWEPLNPEMEIAVDVGRERRMDTVVVEIPLTSWAVKMALDVMGPDGKWEMLSDTPQQSEVESPLGLRREATSVLSDHGVHYFLCSDDDFGAEDYKKRMPEWGISLLGESRGWRLYRIEAAAGQ